MIKALRKRHLQIWTIAAFLLPLGILSATILRKDFPVQHSSYPLESQLAIVIAEHNEQKYAIQLRGSEPGKARQLVWYNRQPLQVPSAEVYKSASGNSFIKEAKYIGRIEGRGSYFFDLAEESKDSLHLILYDFIHQQIIDRINF